MGPYGSVGAHIKTGPSPMAQDHFPTPHDPRKAYERPKNPKTSDTISYRHIAKAISPPLAEEQRIAQSKSSANMTQVTGNHHHPNCYLTNHQQGTFFGSMPLFSRLR